LILGKVLGFLKNKKDPKYKKLMKNMLEFRKIRMQHELKGTLFAQPF